MEMFGTDSRTGASCGLLDAKCQVLHLGACCLHYLNLGFQSLHLKPRLCTMMEECTSLAKRVSVLIFALVIDLAFGWLLELFSY